MYRFQQKRLENRIALSSLREVLTKIDSITDEKQRLFMVSKGILAGNVFDWGAQKVVEMMQSQEGLSFHKAIDQVPGRVYT